MVEPFTHSSDPTALTTDQLRRELAALRDSIDTRLNGMDKSQEMLYVQINRQPADVEKAIQQLRDLNNEKFEGARRERDSIGQNVKTQLTDLTTVFTNRLDSLSSSFTARHDAISQGFDSRLNGLAASFTNQIDSLASGIEKQFQERDIRSKASEVGAQTAVSAALQAQKEAAGAQNESNSAAILKSESSTTKQIDGITALLASNSKSLDDKISVINGRLDRGEGKQTGSSSSISTIIAVIAVVAAIGSALVSFSTSHSNTPQAVYQSQPPQFYPPQPPK